MGQHPFMMWLLRIFHDRIHRSQFKTTSWVFMSNTRWKPTQSTDLITSPQRQSWLQSPAPLLLPSWPQGGGCLYPPRVGYSELGQRRCPRQKVLKCVPQKVANVYPCASVPCPPIARAGRKKRLKPTPNPNPDGHCPARMCGDGVH